MAVRFIALFSRCKLNFNAVRCQFTRKLLQSGESQCIVAYQPRYSGSFGRNEQWFSWLFLMSLLAVQVTPLVYLEEEANGTLEKGNEENEDILNISPNYSAVPSLKRERDSSLCGSCQYPANKPIEDRYTIEKLQNGGWWFAVFDGHGGWQCSDYAHDTLHKNFEIELNNHLGYFPKQDSLFSKLTNKKHDNPEDSFRGKISSKVIVRALKAAFKRTDRQYMAKVTGAFELGFGRDTRAGSCAIAVFVIDGVLFCANSGDSRAVVVSSKNVSKAESQVLGRFSRFMRRAKEDSPVAQASYQQKVQRRITKVDPARYLEQVSGIKQELAEIALKKSLGYECDPQAEQNLREQLFIALQKTSETFGDILDLPPVSRDKIPQPSVLSRLSSFFFFSTATSDGRDSTTAETLVPDIASLDFSKYVEAITVSNDHNAKVKSEQDKLKLKHPNESDIIFCRNANSCYVKGRLQPTRAFGDFYLKYSEFELPKKSDDAKSKPPIPFTPPYISCVPEIIMRPITKEAKQSDELLVIGSDGLWDMLSNQDVAEKVLRWVRIEGLTPKQASERLVEEALAASAAKHNLSIEELKALKKGRQRRTKHDDITVVIVDLSQLMDLFYYG